MLQALDYGNGVLEGSGGRIQKAEPPRHGCCLKNLMRGRTVSSYMLNIGFSEFEVVL